MHLSLSSPFPAVYFSVICKKHDARVSIRSTDVEARGLTSQTQIFSTGCAGSTHKSKMECSNEWEMHINGGGTVTIRS